MKTIHAITLATALVPGDGSAAFAAETVVNGTPNATTTTNTDAKPMNNADRGQTTCTSSSMSTTGSTSGTIAPGTALDKKEKQDPDTKNGGPDTGE